MVATLHFVSMRKEKVAPRSRSSSRPILISWTCGSAILRTTDTPSRRVPLYIPPYIVDPNHLAAYQALDSQMARAAMRYDFAERERLAAEQKKLARFRPWMKHSFIEKSHPIIFHPQMVAASTPSRSYGPRCSKNWTANSPAL